MLERVGHDVAHDTAAGLGRQVREAGLGLDGYDRLARRIRVRQVRHGYGVRIAGSVHSTY